MIFNATSIPLALDAEQLAVGIRYPIPWDFHQAPHLLVFGSTGSGKTYAVKLLLARIGLHFPNAKVWICDYKNDDFKDLAGCPRYYGFDQCARGLNDFFACFTARQSGKDQTRSFCLLVFDEWASYLNTLDKKQVEEEKHKLSTLLMLGRSYNIHVLVSQQRPDAQYFSTARDNFNLIMAMGNISKEAKDMLFSAYKDAMPPVKRKGAGYLLDNGTGELKEIQVPTVRQQEKLSVHIKLTVS